MRHGIQIVAPYRPFPPESPLHQGLVDFDWMAAIRMMAHSASLACHCPVMGLTDLETALPIPAWRVPTTETRLMLWTLEVTRLFLESPHFDRDTILVDCDQLFYRDLAGWFQPHVDLTVLVRPTVKHLDGGMPLLNGVQFLARKGIDRLIPFYQRALDLAKTMPEDLIRWGADTEAVCRLLTPIEVGVHERSGAAIQMVDSDRVLEAMSSDQMRWLEEGRMPWPSRSVLDFRWTRKPAMPKVYRATIMKGAVIP